MIANPLNDSEKRGHNLKEKEAITIDHIHMKKVIKEYSGKPSAKQFENLKEMGSFHKNQHKGSGTRRYRFQNRHMTRNVKSYHKQNSRCTWLY